jgi:hypothetical protein
MNRESDFIDLLACGRNSVEYGSGKKSVVGTHSSWVREKKKKRRKKRWKKGEQFRKVRGGMRNYE